MPLIGSWRIWKGTPPTRSVSLCVVSQWGCFTVRETSPWRLRPWPCGAIFSGTFSADVSFRNQRTLFDRLKSTQFNKLKRKGKELLALHCYARTTSSLFLAKRKIKCRASKSSRKAYYSTFVLGEKWQKLALKSGFSIFFLILGSPYLSEIFHSKKVSWLVLTGRRQISFTRAFFHICYYNHRPPTGTGPFNFQPR